MAQHQVKFDQFIAAPREKVFAYFADHEKFGRIFGGGVRRIHDSPDPTNVNGLGSVRSIKAPGMMIEETITRFEPPALIEYTVTKGGPIKNHLGHIEFHVVDGGTQVLYTISFDAKVPFTGGLIGSLICAGFHRGIDRAVREIASA